MTQTLLVLTLGAALAASACGTTAADADDAALNSENAQAGGAAKRAGTRSAAANRPVYREVTIPTGTALPLALTNAVGSDTSAVEDAVSARLTQAITIDGRDVLPAGARLNGEVTAVDGPGRVKGRAMIAFRFTSLRNGDDQYDIEAAPVSQLASATKGEDATKIGIGAGAGAIIGGILGGGGGAAKGAVIGGGAGTGVVLATKGKEIRLAPGANVSTELTAPLTIRVHLR